MSDFGDYISLGKGAYFQETYQKHPLGSSWLETQGHPRLASGHLASDSKPRELDLQARSSPLTLYGLEQVLDYLLS